jgi:hypothetical protein
MGLINISILKRNRTPIVWIVLSVICYWYFGYHLVRTAYAALLLLYVILFVCFYFLIKSYKTQLKPLAYIAFGFRALFILSIPNLSQDFYRFLWDGRMILEGLNPYLYTVESFISQGTFPVPQAQLLREGMGALNASHYTNYPPINQLCFVISNAWTSHSLLGSVFVMRLLLIAADFGTLHFGSKLLLHLKLPVHQIYWYLLNPFIIIELVGNLHFEGVMIFFLVWSLYLLYIKKWQWAAVVFALSISVKLMPLIFLPLFFQWFMKKSNVLKHLGKLSAFYAIIIGTTLLLFLPFYNAEFITNYSQTVALWFQNFEFNASLYYVARAIGYSFRGYNEIAIIGKVTPIIVILVTLAITFFRKNTPFIPLITAMLLVLSFYFFTSTTVHPWYVATLVILSVFTKYRYPLVWSFVIILSYLAYVNLNKADKSENLWVIALEYIFVYVAFILDIRKKKSNPTYLRIK